MILTANIISGVFSESVFGFGDILALSPHERFGAMRRLSGNLVAERWFAEILMIVLVALVVMLVAISLYRRIQDSKFGDKRFSEGARKKGLSEHESQVLLDVAHEAGVKRNESIFSLDSIFDRGAAGLVETVLARDGEAKCKELRIELSFLREKLGFARQQVTSQPGAKKISSRQLPTGKKISLRRLHYQESVEIEAIILKNTSSEITVRLITPYEGGPGQVWRGRYYFGVSIWEFDTSVESCDEGVMVLNHSDAVRFVSRRSFLRVMVQKPAFIAPFAFSRILEEKSEESEDGVEPGESPTVIFNPPEFTSAVITELAGPGLRIEAMKKTSQDMNVGDRVLVVFRLDDEKAGKRTSSQFDGEKSPSKLIEDVGVVRHVKAIENGRVSLAVELVGLNDSNVNELVRATNAASLTFGSEKQTESDSESEVKQPEADAVV